MIPDDLSIPEFLLRPVTAATKAAVTRLNNEIRRGSERRVVASSGRSTISAGHSLNLDEAGKAMLQEIRKTERKKSERENARLDALPKKEATVAKSTKKIGTKEKANRDKRTAKTKTKATVKATSTSLSALAAELDPNKTAGGDVALAGKGPGPTKPLPVHVPGANPPIPADPKKAAAAVKAAAKKAAKAKPAASESSRPDGLRDGSKQAAMLDMALREGGATEEQICKKLGWKKCRVTLKRVCDRVGAKLVRDDDGRFHATLPTKKAA